MMQINVYVFKIIKELKKNVQDAKWGNIIFRIKKDVYYVQVSVWSVQILFLVKNVDTDSHLYHKIFLVLILLFVNLFVGIKILV